MCSHSALVITAILASSGCESRTEPSVARLFARPDVQTLSAMLSDLAPHTATGLLSITEGRTSLPVETKDLP